MWQGHHHRGPQAVINAPETPGVYAIAVWASRFEELGTPVSLKLFNVGYPDFPPPDRGPDGAKPPSPFARPDYPFPPWGAYLDQGNCAFDLDFQPEDMDLRFVYWQDGKYLPLDGDLQFGQSFFIEGKLKKPARKNVYFTQITIPNGEERKVSLFISKDDDRTVRSEMLYFIWESPEETSQ